MIKKDIDILSEYYQYELSYLRSVGRDFASRFPKIARRLDLSQNESSDPQIERLIESVAFLTGKLQKQVDDQFPEIGAALLNVLYPPLLAQLPSCTMVNFDVDTDRATQTPGFVVPKNTQLHAISTGGETCTFMTSHDLELWPLSIESTDIVQKEDLPSYYASSVYYLKIGINYPQSIEKPKRIRVYINANALLKAKIFAAIFSTDNDVIFGNNKQYHVSQGVKPVGIEDQDALLPYPNTVHKGFRVLQEYFAFPDKFYGFDITVPADADISGHSNIYIPLGHELFMQVLPSNFSTTSVPAVNLFPKVSEPLRLDYKQVEYRLVPDYRRYQYTEIYTIDKIVAINPEDNSEMVLPEFFACNYGCATNDDSVFWMAKRRKTCVPNASGDDIYLSFVDVNFDAQSVYDRVLYAYTLCTNRGMSEQIPAMGELQVELPAPVKCVYCVDRPTAQKPALQNGQALWKLISILSLNSFSFGSDGDQKIKNVLNTFADLTSSRLSKEVDAILSVDSSVTSKRIGDQVWKGFISGTEVNITFDDAIDNMGLPLSLVISKFLSTYTTINTFVDVVACNNNGELKRWEEQLGMQNYL